MKKKLLTIALLLAFTLLGPALVPSAAASAACPAGNDPKGQVLEGIDQTGDCDTSGINNLMGTIVTILSWVAGVAAIIMILVSGFKYITSGGDSGKVSSAKSALIYALVGVAVAVLAQLLVRFVITQADVSSTSKPCPVGQHRSEDGKKCIPDS